MLRLRATLFAVMAFAMAGFAVAAPNYPALTGRVVDQAAILTADQSTILTNRLRDFETNSGHQMAVAIITSLEGNDIAPYANTLFRNWQLGSKEKNDGVLILVAPKEHKVRIEVGYGLEGDLTDAMSSVVINHTMVPRFKSNDYFGGLYAGVDDIQKIVAGEGEQVKQAAQNQSVEEPTLFDVLPFLIFFIFVAWMIYRASQGRVIFLPGGSGGSSSGGWSSGGGGGGFSGGGGSSGGGGASGSW